jgi:preprotein translocase subunit YajC
VEATVQFLNGFVHLAQVGLQPASAGAAAPVAGAAPAAGAAAPAANAAAGAAQAAPGGDGWMMLVWIGVMVLVFWLLIFRPQQKKAKQHQQLLAELKAGESVITTGGIYGKLVGFDDNVATVEIAANTRIRILKSQLAGRATPPDKGGADKDKALVEKN